MMVYQTRMKKNNQLGITLLEMVMAVAILGMVLVGVMTMTNQMTEDSKANAAALHLKTVGKAANEYIQKNFAAVTAAATATKPALIKISTMVTDGQLPTGFQSQNVYRQQTCVLVLEPTSNNLEAMVVTEGGTPISDLTLGQIAGAVGGDGGGIYASAPTTFRGTLGGWSFPFGNYNAANDLNQRCNGGAGAITLAAGHPVMALWFADGSAVSATLYRNRVTGNPELNTMNTPILMGTTATKTEGSATADCAAATRGAIARAAGTGAVLSCTFDGINYTWQKAGSRYWKDPVANFASLPVTDDIGAVRITRDTNRAFAWNGTNWVALAVDQSGNLNVPNNLTVGRDIVAGRDVINGRDMSVGRNMAVTNNIAAGNNITATNNIRATQDLIADDEVRATGRITTNEYLRIASAAVTIGAACTPSGLIGRMADGTIANCVSGTWRLPGGVQMASYQTGANIRVVTGVDTTVMSRTVACLGPVATIMYGGTYVKYGLEEVVGVRLYVDGVIRHEGGMGVQVSGADFEYTKSDVCRCKTRDLCGLYFP